MKFKKKTLIFSRSIRNNTFIRKPRPWIADVTARLCRNMVLFPFRCPLKTLEHRVRVLNYIVFRLARPRRSRDWFTVLYNVCSSILFLRRFHARLSNVLYAPSAVFRTRTCRVHRARVVPSRVCTYTTFLNFVRNYNPGAKAFLCPAFRALRVGVQMIALSNKYCRLRAHGPNIQRAKSPRRRSHVFYGLHWRYNTLRHWEQVKI